MITSVRKKTLIPYAYRVTSSDRGFLAYCREMDIGSEGKTVSKAISALRDAIYVRNEEL